MLLAQELEKLPLQELQRLKKRHQASVLYHDQDIPLDTLCVVKPPTVTQRLVLDAEKNLQKRLAVQEYYDTLVECEAVLGWQWTLD